MAEGTTSSVVTDMDLAVAVCSWFMCANIDTSR